MSDSTAAYGCDRLADIGDRFGAEVTARRARGDRERAQLNREQAARDREQAARDRERAASDRKEAARDRNQPATHDSWRAREPKPDLAR
jgi:hypothetical protein